MVDPSSGVIRRHHLYGHPFQRAFKRAVQLPGVPKPATPHTLRHCFTKHPMQSGSNIRTVQKLLGHSDVAPELIYTNVMWLGAWLCAVHSTDCSREAVRRSECPFLAESVAAAMPHIAVVERLPPRPYAKAAAAAA